MNNINALRNSIIDKLLTISDEENLISIHQLVTKSSSKKDVLDLSDAQSEILQLSEQDIAYGRTITQDELDKSDLEWLKGL